MIKSSLNRISNIRFGIYAKPQPEGAVYYLQARHFSEEGELDQEPDEYISLNESLASNVLQEGDVLFVGKGNRLFSWCFKTMQKPAIASSIFFVLRPDAELVYPEYLAAILNAPQTRNTFLQIGSGTNIFSIRKSELGAFEVPLPPIAEQKKIAALSQLYQRQIALSNDLIKEQQNLYTAIFSQLISQKIRWKTNSLKKK